MPNAFHPLALTAALAAANLAAPVTAQRCVIDGARLAIGAEPGDGVGSALAISNGRLAVGVRRGARNDGGAVYLFDLGSLSSPIELLHPDGQSIDRFGSAVALDATTVVVGAPRDIVRFSTNGSAHVFDARDGAFVRSLAAPVPGLDELFGASVAVAPGAVLIGAPYDIDYGLQGSAYLYDDQGRLRRQLWSDFDGWDGFGTAVALDGDLAIVGAPWVDVDGASSNGAAYLFDASSGALIRRLELPAPHPGAQFGTAVAIDASIVVVGAPFDAPSGVGTGAVHVFAVATGDWIAALAPPDGSFYDYFGASVSIGDGRIAVGAIYAGPADAGAVYVFDAATFAFLAKVEVPRVTRYDDFGASVALGSDRLAVGAPFTDTGNAYLFTIECAPACPADITGDGVVDAADIASLLGAWGPCAGCPAELTHDGVVDASDLAILLGAWGMCGQG